ncbi:MAG: YHYH protein [Myxococcota bacterium]
MSALLLSCLASACHDTATSDDSADGASLTSETEDGATEGSAESDTDDSASNPDSASGDDSNDDADDGTADETGDDGSDSDTDPGNPFDDDYEPGTCFADLFVAPPPHPANGAYPAPELTAMCTEDRLIVQSNGIPGYEFQPITPNDLQASDFQFQAPRNPTEAGQPTTIPLLGTVAFAINGMPIFGPNEAEFPDPYGDPIFNGIMDFCLGHTAMGGRYHYHGLLVECLIGDVPVGEPSPIIGFALDGYPIYGPVGCLDNDCNEVMRLQSGWVQTGNPTTYAWDNHEYMPSDDPTVLDECNGRVGPDGNYRYHATETFPYVLGCYRGQPL